MNEAELSLLTVGKGYPNLELCQAEGKDNVEIWPMRFESWLMGYHSKGFQDGFWGQYTELGVGEQKEEI